MATYDKLQSRVENRVIDLPSAVSTEVPILINKVLRDLQEDHVFKVMETETGQMQTTANNHTLASVPSDLRSYRGKPYYIDNNGETYSLEITSSRQAIHDRFGVDTTIHTGSPEALLDPEPDDTGSRSWEVYPAPDGNSTYSNGEYRIVVPYYRYLPDLSGGADENWFTNNAEWYIIYQATAEAFFMNWDEQRGQIWQALATQELQRVRERDKLFRYSHSDTMVPKFGARGPDLTF